MTGQPGVLLTVTIADCVPVFIADPVRRAVGLFHAGWRGTAAGVFESGMATLGEAFGSTPGDITVHLGPAICGECYEVGPEVSGHSVSGHPRHPVPSISGGSSGDGRPSPVSVPNRSPRAGNAPGAGTEDTSRTGAVTKVASVLSSGSWREGAHAPPPPEPSGHQ